MHLVILSRNIVVTYLLQGVCYGCYNPGVAKGVLILILNSELFSYP